MNYADLETATREQLADELAAACEYTEDWETASIENLRERVSALMTNHPNRSRSKYRVTNIYAFAPGYGSTHIGSGDSGTILYEGNDRAAAERAARGFGSTASVYEQRIYTDDHGRDNATVVRAS